MAEEPRRRSRAPAARSSTVRERSVAVRLRDGVVVAVGAYDADAERRGGGRAGRRRGAAARARRHPRPRQRAGSHRLGGLRQRDPRRGRRGRHHDRRHAAQQHPADHHGRGARGEAGGRRGPGLGRRRLLGRRGARQRRRPRAPPRRRGLRLQVLPARLGRGGVPAPRRRPSSPTRWPRPRGSARCMLVHAEDADAIADVRPRGGVRRLPGRAGRTPPRSGPIDAGHRHRARAPAAAPTSCTSAPRVPCRRCGPPGRTGVDVSRRDLPALPALRGRRRSPTAPPSSSAARRSATPPTATPCGRALVERRHRPRRHRPLAVHRRPQAPGHRRLRRRLGRDRLAPARACRSCGPAPASAACPSPTWCAGWPPPRPAGWAWPARARSPWAPTRTSASSRPTRRWSSTRRALHHKNPVSAYAGRTLTGTVRATWLRGVPVDLSRPTARPAAEERADERGGAMTYWVPRGGLPPQTDLTTDRARLHRGVRRAAARHHARHRRQPAAALGRHPAVGDRPAAVRLRRDLLVVRRGGGARRRDRAARRRPRRGGGALRRRRDGPRSTVDGIDPPRSGPAATRSCRRGRAGRCATTGRRRPRPSTGSARPTSGSTASRCPSRSSTHEDDVAAEPMPDTDGAWGTQRFVDPARRAARHARQHRQLRARAERSRSRRPT